MSGSAASSSPVIAAARRSAAVRLGGLVQAVQAEVNRPLQARAPARRSSPRRGRAGCRRRCPGGATRGTAPRAAPRPARECRAATAAALRPPARRAGPPAADSTLSASAGVADERRVTVVPLARPCLRLHRRPPPRRSPRGSFVITSAWRASGTVTRVGMPPPRSNSLTKSNPDSKSAAMVSEPESRTTATGARSCPSSSSSVLSYGSPAGLDVGDAGVDAKSVGQPAALVQQRIDEPRRLLDLVPQRSAPSCARPGTGSRDA